VYVGDGVSAADASVAGCRGEGPAGCRAWGYPGERLARRLLTRASAPYGFGAESTDSVIHVNTVTGKYFLDNEG
jgi:hypothetical protein